MGKGRTKRRKQDIDRAVALLLGKKKAEVALITAAFLREVAWVLAEDDVVHLEGLGRFSIDRAIIKTPTGIQKRWGPKEYRPITRARVTFAKSALLTKMIKEKTMEKSQKDYPCYPPDDDREDEGGE